MITVVNVMIPRPPTWIRNRIHACPAVVKYVAVSTTIRPVTQTALVAVKSASSHPSGAPV
jgi:hypothetical protein